MNLKKLLPKSIRTLSRKDRTVVTILAGSALAATAIVLLHRSKDSPHSPGSRVAGAFTDLAKSLGMEIGSGLDVKTAQRYLNQIAGAKLVEDGTLGTDTAAALKKFQAGNNIEQSGAIDEETGNALQYFAAATSKSASLQKLATVTTTAPEDVVYTPKPMPEGRPSPYLNPVITYTPAAAPGMFGSMVAQNPALGAPFTKTLKMSIKGAQRALNDLTGASLALTGHLDHSTIAALQNFQAEQALPATGHIDSETANALLYLAAQHSPTRVSAYRRAPHAGHVAGVQSTNLYDSRFHYSY